MDIDLVLVPVDGSDRSEQAAEYAVSIAKQYDAALHLLFVLDERRRSELNSGAIKAETVADTHRSFADRVREYAAERGHDMPVSTSTATAFSQQRLTQTPGSVVLDVAADVDADFIVVPRQGDGSEPIGRAALYVLEYASQPVLSI